MHIAFTLSTIPLLLLAAYLWHRSKGQMLPVAMFMAAFQAASILNIEIGGSQLGIGPAYLLLLIAIAQKALIRNPSSATVGNPLRSTTLLLLAFAAYATITAFICPWLFRGIPILNPKFGGSVVPLEWNAGFLNQLVYLFILLSLYLIAAYKTNYVELERSVTWYVGGTVLAAFFSIYQYFSLKTGIYFPTEFLHTSPTYAIFEGYEINGLPRMNSTFTEAAAAGQAFMTGLAIVSWRILSGFASIRNIFIAGALFIGLFLTISTSGYLSLGFVAAVACWKYLRRTQSGLSARVARTLLLVPIAAILLILIANPGAREASNSLLHTVILDKTDSSSYHDRTEANQDALQTAAATFWIGAGYGVCRASSLIPTMLGTLGIPGLLLFAVASLQLLRPAFQRKGVRYPFHGAVLFAASASLVDLCIAGPELTGPILWLLLAIASRFSALKTKMPPSLRKSRGSIASQSSVSLDARPHRPTQGIPAPLYKKDHQASYGVS